MQTLTTGKIIGIIVGLVVIVGGGYTLMHNTPAADRSHMIKDMAMDADKPMNIEEKGTGASLKASFAEMLGKSGSQKCAVSQSSNTSKSEGVFYFSAGKGRGDFVNTILSGPGAGTSIKTSMIMEKDVIYTWQTGTTQGMKMVVPNEQKTTQPATAPTNVTAEQFNQTYDYKCSDWKADASVFVPPTTVKFMDMAEMMKAMPTMGGVKAPVVPSPTSGGSVAPSMPKGMDMSAMCAQCDQAGDGKEACLAAMGCT